MLQQDFEPSLQRQHHSPGRKVPCQLLLRWRVRWRVRQLGTVLPIALLQAQSVLLMPALVRVAAWVLARRPERVSEHFEVPELALASLQQVPPAGVQALVERAWRLRVPEQEQARTVERGPAPRPQSALRGAGQRPQERDELQVQVQVREQAGGRALESARVQPPV